MTEPPAPELQFDKAEFASSEAATPACAACQAPITGEYYDVNGQTVCPACKVQVAQTLAASPGAGALPKAIAGGIVGGIIGASIYFAVLALSGYEIGIIAIAVGWLVGKGVNLGTGGRGGPLYQALAMTITYLAIVSTHALTALVHIMRERGAAFGDLVARLNWGYVLAEPFLDGVENILGIIIIGIGLYEAWKVNKRVALTITGPFHAAFRPAAPVPPPAAAAGTAPGP